MSDLFEKLNEAQTEAVTSTEGYIRVIAGAGSGKTRALSHRFAYLVNELGIRPGNILCVTFTNKAAAEMRQRIHQLTGDNDTGMIATFHGFCVSVLQEDSHAVSYPKSFLVLDNSDIDAMLAMIYEERGLTLRDKTFGQARDMFEMRKCVYEQGYYKLMISMSVDELYQKYLAAESVDDILFYGYLYQEKKCFALDYNDLIWYVLYIFETFPDIRLKWQKRLEYIMIDEFQDIDPLQYELMEHICGYHNNLFIVGDPDQTIYTWRGARIGFLLNFDQKFPDVQTIMMMQNYRSTPEILACANSLIRKNHNRIEKDLIPVLPAGTKPVYFHAKNIREEAEWIAAKIKSLHESGVPYRDITLLYRAHYVTRMIEEVFAQKELPYTVYSGVPFYGRAEIKDALCYLRMIVYKDDLSFMRVVNQPKRNMGRRRIAFLQEYAQEHDCTLYEALNRTLDNEIFQKTKAGQFVELIEKYARSYADKEISQVLTEILDESGYERMLRTEGSQERLDNLAELKQAVHDFEVTSGEENELEQYLRSIAFMTNNDLNTVADKVKLMTVHAAKGLEFPVVFLCSMSEGVFPSRKVSSQNAMEEERRLAYVAITRAEKQLYLSDAEGYNFDNSARVPSRFIRNIDPELLVYERELNEDLIKRTDAYISSSEASLMPDEDHLPYQIGDRVNHKVFGAGVIKEIDTENGAYVIAFERMKTPRGISFKAAGKLEKITDES